MAVASIAGCHSHRPHRTPAAVAPTATGWRNGRSGSSAWHGQEYNRTISVIRSLSRFFAATTTSLPDSRYSTLLHLRRSENVNVERQKTNYPLFIIVLAAFIAAGFTYPTMLVLGWPLLDAALSALLAGLLLFVVLSVLFWLVRGVWRLLHTNRARPLLARVYDVNVPTPKKENHTTALIICTLLAIVALPSAYYNFIGIGYDSIDSLLLALMTVSIRFVVFFIIVYPILRAIWRVVRRQ